MRKVYRVCVCGNFWVRFCGVCSRFVFLCGSSVFPGSWGFSGVLVMLYCIAKIDALGSYWVHIGFHWDHIGVHTGITLDFALGLQWFSHPRVVLVTP